MTNIIIAEDDKLIQEHFVKLFAADGRFHLVGAVRDAFEAERLCSRNIDLVLMDVHTLHRHSGLAAGKRIRESWPNVRVVIMTSLVDPEVLSKAKSGCADGLCYKDHGDEEVMAVIERVLNGERSFPGEAPPVELEDVLSSDVKPIQLEILRLYIRGMSYAEIGQKLGITGDAARWHIREMVSQCGFDSKEELMAAAIESKLIVTSLKDE
ncbi:MAG: response regulator [Eubacteriales bacterium]